MEYVYLALILVWFILGVWAAVIAIRKVRISRLSLIWLAPAMVLGASLGWWFSDLEYFEAPDLRVIGFPLPVAVFERMPEKENGWIDYVGSLSLPFFVANFMLGLMTPVIVSVGAAAVMGKIRRRDLKPLQSD